MARVWSILLLVAFLPAAAACTSGPGTHQKVSLVVMEGDRELLSLPTDITVGPNSYCGRDEAPPLAFDGRFAAWSHGSTFHVVDVESGADATHYPVGVLTEGRLAVRISPGALDLYDLRDGASRRVEAPDGEVFIGNFPGAVVAGGWDSGNGSAPGHVSVLDPVTGAWRVLRAPVGGGGLSGLQALAASREWVVLAGGGAWSLEVATGHVARMAEWGGDKPAIQGDRLYLTTYAQHATYTFMAGPTFWSVRLPAGDDRQAGAMPPPGPIRGRTASFVADDTPTSTLTQASTTTASQSATTWRDDVPPRVEATLFGMASGLALLVVGAASARRRLP